MGKTEVITPVVPISIGSDGLHCTVPQRNQSYERKTIRAFSTRLPGFLEGGSDGGGGGGGGVGACRRRGPKGFTSG